LFLLDSLRGECRLASAEFGTRNSQKQRKTASFLAVFHDRRSSEIEDFRGKRNAVR